MNEPSPIDQVFRHWWPSHGHYGSLLGPDMIMKPGPLVRPMINIQNVCDYIQDYATRNGAFGEQGTYDSGAFPPWSDFGMFFRIRSHSGPMLYYLLLGSVDPCKDGDAHIMTVRGFEYSKRNNQDLDLSVLSVVAFVLFQKHVPTGIVCWGTSGLSRDSVEVLKFIMESCVVRGDSKRFADEYYNSLLPRTPQERNGMMRSSAFCVHAILAAAQFANCKNVVQRERGFTNRPPKWNTPRHPRVRYRVLVIDGKLTPRAPTDEEPTRHGVALHIVRGHFATYTPEKPLFGKYVGRFWIAQHARGAEEHGKVYKDYQIGKSPENGPQT